MSSGTHKDGERDGFPKNEKELEKYGVWVKSGPKDISPANEAVLSDESENVFPDSTEMPDFSFLDNSENIAFESQNGSKESDSLSMLPDDTVFSQSALLTEDTAAEDDDFSVEDLHLDDLELNSDSPTDFSTEDSFELSVDKPADSVEETSFDDPFSSTDTVQEEMIIEENLDINSSVFAEKSENEEIMEDRLQLPEDTFPEIKLELDEPAFDTIEESTEKSEDSFENISFEAEEPSAGEITEEIMDMDDIVTETASDDDIIAYSDVKINADTEVFDDENMIDPIHQIMATENKPAENDEKLILQKIASELSVLHSEFVSLKKEIESLKQLGIAVQTEKTPVENKETFIPQEEETVDSGFFSSDVEDDAIALSGDELDNILANADFTQEIVQDEEVKPEEDPVIPQENLDNAEEAQITVEEAQIADEETVIPEEIDDSVFQMDTPPKIAFEDEVLQEPSLDSIEMPVFEEEGTLEIDLDLTDDIFVASEGEEEPAAAMPVCEEPVSEPLTAETADDEMTIDEAVFEDIILDEQPAEEPVFSGFVQEPETTDDPFAGISIEDALDDNAQLTANSADEEVLENSDIFVASDADEQEISDNPLSEDNISYLEQDVPFNQIDEIHEDDEDSDLPTETVFDSAQWSEEPVLSVLDETFEAPLETILSDSPAADDLVMSSPDTVNDENGNPVIPQDLKFEIKSVLSYMDQLLENLPEDKIAEFAQSEHFDTYKKLFKELGLST